LLTGINQETEKLEKQMKSTMNKTKRSNKAAFSAALLLSGVMAIGQSSIYTAAAADGINSVSSASCSTTSDYRVTLTGSFSTEISNVWVQPEFGAEIQIPTTSWSQTPTTLALTIPASSAKVFTIRTYNGGDVLAQVFSCTEAVVVTPPPTDTTTDTTTEDGGTLPNTGSNNYNYLVAGIGLALVGTRGLLRRKPIQE
jgi:LPXTG-motif cell wall-anchored protein